LQVNMRDLDKWIHYEGVTPGRRAKGTMTAVNIAPKGTKPEWRVDERQFIVWMKETRILPMAR
jgi:hypothetical protein